METIWFALVVFTLANYVVLDGFDLGAGALHLLVAKTDAERRQVIRSIGPVWDGNEVWLLASGGALFVAFPRVLATGLSGFYLPIMILLWLLVFRALGIELRHHVHDPLWTRFWDAAFATSSAILIVVLGAALGNVVRGVSFTEAGHFFAPLWTHFDTRDPVGVLDAYTVLLGIVALLVLTEHGSLWLAFRTDGAVHERAVRLGRRLYPASLLGMGIVTGASFVVQPRLADAFSERPLTFLAGLPILAVFLVPIFRNKSWHGRAFLASALRLYGLLVAAAVGLYPWLLPGTKRSVGLGVHDASAPDDSLGLGLLWWIPGIALVLVCQHFVYTHLPRVVSATDEAEH